MIARHSHEQSEKGEGVEVVKNEPIDDEKHGKGQYTEKRIYLSRSVSIPLCDAHSKLSQGKYKRSSGQREGLAFWSSNVRFLFCDRFVSFLQSVANVDSVDDSQLVLYHRKGVELFPLHVHRIHCKYFQQMLNG